MVRPRAAGRCVADIFDEIRDDLRAERARTLLRRFGPLLAVLVVLVVAGAGGWQVWRSRQAERADDVATSFLGAMRKADGVGAAAEAKDTPARTEAAAEFGAIAGSGPEGYRTLARLREAALRAAAGDGAAALQLWDQVGADPAADPLLRDVAALLWAQNQVDHGDPAAVEAHLASLVAPGNPWRPLAEETQGLLALRTGQDARARELLRQLSTDPTAPPGIRTRTGVLLSRLGEPPVAGRPDDPAAAPGPGLGE